MDIDQTLRRVFGDAPFIAHLGIELENLGPGFGEASLTLQPWHLQQTQAPCPGAPSRR